MAGDFLALIKAVGLAELASSALQKAAERLAGPHLESAIEAARAAFATDLPINHDLERGLRLAQLAGTTIILADHERMDDADRVRRPADPFLKPGFEWVRAQCGVCARLSVTRNEALVGALEQALNRPLAEANRGPESAEARKAREALERQAWQELCAAVPATPDPMLEARFFGRIEGEPGWFAAFLAVFREMLKDNPKVRVPYITSRLAQILMVGQRTAALVETILAEQREGFADLGAKVGGLAVAQSRFEDTLSRHTALMMEQFAREKGVEPWKLRPLFEHLGHLGLTDAEIRDRAEGTVAEILARAQAAPPRSNADAEVAEALTEARARLGTLDTAGALAGLTANIGEQVARRVAPLLREKAEIERLTYDHAAAEATLRQLLALDPSDVWAWIDLGDRAVTTGRLDAAADAFARAMDAAARRSAADPGDDEAARDLSVSHNKVGDVQVARGELDAALASFRASLAIRARLAEADPRNAGWQRDLSVSHNKVGDVQVARGELDAALASFRASHDIFARLAEADPRNAGWQRDLSVSHERIGDVQVARGELDAALASFRAGLDIAARLAEADPRNAGWQRDLAISHERIGDFEARCDRTAEAIAGDERSLAIYQALVARQPDDAPARLLSVVPLWRLGVLRGEAGRPALEEALAILRPLAAEDRLDHGRRGWIAAIEADLARSAPGRPPWWKFWAG